MLLVDYRDGSNYLADPLAQMGVPVYRETDGSLPTLTAGDLAFVGRGLGGVSINFGVEFKKLPDLISSLRTGRLSGEQLPKLLGPQGEFHYAWLVIEGRWKTGDKGEILVPTWRSRHMEWVPLRGGMPASEMVKKVLTLSVSGGLRPWWTNGRDETLDFLAALYRWGSDKDLDKHLSHLDPHKPQAFIPVPPKQATLMTFPGIGRAASFAAKKHFGSISNAAVATAAQWADVLIESKDKKGNVKTRKLGMKVAEELVAYLREK